MSIATMLFFMWGFLTCLNDILIPHLKAIFELNYAQAMLVQFCFFSSYFIFALPAGKLVHSDFVTGRSGGRSAGSAGRDRHATDRDAGDRQSHPRGARPDAQPRDPAPEREHESAPAGRPDANPYLSDGRIGQDLHAVSKRPPRKIDVEDPFR